MRPQTRFLACTVALILGLSLASTGAQAGPARELQRDSLKQLRAHWPGRPIVVHIWGLSCAPCHGELPQWSALFKALPRTHLMLVQVDAAPLDEVDRALKQVGLSGADNWTMGPEADEYLRASLDPQWQGDTPRTVLIAPDGRLTRIQGVADLGQVKQWLRTGKLKP